jgi:membrane protein implicated in regulation of membrane protease activity
LTLDVIKPMISKVLLIIAISVVVFELIEHVIFPLVWLALRRKRPSLSGSESMIGKVVEVKDWHRHEGRVFVQGELWQAVGNGAFVEGEEAIVESVAGLELRIKPLGNAKEAKK